MRHLCCGLPLSSTARTREGSRVKKRRLRDWPLSMLDTLTSVVERYIGVTVVGRRAPRTCQISCPRERGGGAGGVDAMGKLKFLQRRKQKMGPCLVLGWTGVSPFR